MIATENTQTDAAQMIVDELLQIVSDETLAKFASDESGNDSLMSYESIVKTRLGDDYDSAAWDEAMERLHAMAADDQIEALRTSAGAASDLAQVDLCDRAIDGDGEARVECARVIIYALGECRA